MTVSTPDVRPHINGLSVSIPSSMPGRARATTPRPAPTSDGYRQRREYSVMLWHLLLIVAAIDRRTVKRRRVGVLADRAIILAPDELEAFGLRKGPSRTHGRLREPRLLRALDVAPVDALSLSRVLAGQRVTQFRQERVLRGWLCELTDLDQVVVGTRSPGPNLRGRASRFPLGSPPAEQDHPRLARAALLRPLRSRRDGPARRSGNAAHASGWGGESLLAPARPAGGRPCAVA
jgi:hypothetical protein